MKLYYLLTYLSYRHVSERRCQRRIIVISSDVKTHSFSRCRCVINYGTVHIFTETTAAGNQTAASRLDEGRCPTRSPVRIFTGRASLVFSRPYLVRSLLCYSVASVVVCTECIAVKRCVLEQKLLLTAYRKSYMRNRLVQNE